MRDTEHRRSPLENVPGCNCSGISRILERPLVHEPSPWVARYLAVDCEPTS
jgi:hypothetical protein